MIQKILRLLSDQQAFFDLMHPTAATHGVFAAFYLESLTSDVQIFGSDNDNIKGSRVDDLVLAGRGNDTVRTSSGGDIKTFSLVGGGHDTLFLAVRERTRQRIEGADDLKAALTRYLGISIRGIENIEFVESAAAVSLIQADARIADANLWGLI